MSDKTSNPSTAFDQSALQATRDTALGALAASGEQALSLIDAWVSAGNAEAVQAVADSGAGAARKAARRALNVLSSRGIRAKSSGHVAVLGRDDRDREAVTEAWFVPSDAAGNSLVVIATRSATKRAESGFFYIHDQLGVHGAQVGTLSGSALKDSLKRAADAGCEPVSISPEYARQLVAKAREQLKKSNMPEPLGMTSAKALLEPVPAEPLPHPLEAEGLELSDDDAKELAQKSGALHALREFRGWLPERGAVEEMLAEIGQHLPEGTDAGPEAVQKVITDAVEAATDRYFGPERRAVLVNRLRDCALSVLATEGETRALELVATIKRIEQAGLITDPPREVPFLRAFFDKALAVMAAQGGGKLQIPRRAPGEAGGEAEPAADAPAGA
ncbi:MAG: hypothetical protein ACOY0T_16175 [Myxococcota bacterium]